jgi:ABC-type lipoprotein release transport system permease subunit
MKKSKITLILFLLLAVMTFFAGCNKQQGESSPENNGQMDILYVENNQRPSQEAKRSIRAMQEITDVKAVNSNDEMFVAVKPKHLERFQLKSLKKEIKKKLEKKNPDLEIIVSTDQKIFKLIGDMEGKLTKKMDTKDIDKELNKIKEKATDEA